LIADGRAPEAQQVLAMVKEQEFYEFTRHTAVADAPKTVATLNSTEKQLDELDTNMSAWARNTAHSRRSSRREGERFGAADRARHTAPAKGRVAHACRQESSISVFAPACRKSSAIGAKQQLVERLRLGVDPGSGCSRPCENRGSAHTDPAFDLGFPGHHRVGRGQPKIATRSSRTMYCATTAFGPKSFKVP